MSIAGTPMAKPVRVSSAYAPTPPGSGGSHMNGTHGGGGSLPNMPPSSLAATDDEEDEYIPQVTVVEFHSVAGHI